MNNKDFLQSWDWGKFQESLGAKIWRLNFNNQILALVIKKELLFGLNYLYIPRGPVIKKADKKSFKNFLEEVKKIAEQEKSVFLKIEPVEIDDDSKNILNDFNFKKSDEIQPLKTLLIDLSKSEDEILGKMEHDTRYSIRVAQKRGVVIKKSFGAIQEEKKRMLEIFYEMFKETARRNKIVIYPEKYFRNFFDFVNDIDMGIFNAYLEGNPIASAIIFFYNNQAFYLYAASKTGYGRYSAPSLILWEAILEAKKKGCRNFDFWGISFDNKNWRGITDFKKSFGGKEYEYFGARDYIFNAPLYKLYQFFNKIRKSWRKISRF